MSTLRSIVLCGGSGTRLWPLSRALYPKQFMDLGGHTLFGDTVDRAAALPDSADPLVVCNEEHRFYVAAALQQKGVSGTILLEPKGRNTAPAIALAAFAALSGGDDPLLLVLPSDHVLKPQAVFAEAVAQARACAESGRIVTFGITPDAPETGFGYIRLGEALPAGGYAVARFVEKPDLARAEAMLADGGYLWNSGMFVWTTTSILMNLQQFMPDIYAGLEQIAAAVGTPDFETVLEQQYAAFRSESIDFGVMEKADCIYTIPGNFGWDDVGNWLALERINATNELGNYIEGDVITVNTQRSTICGKNKLIAAVGVEDLIVIDTEDATLICAKDSTQDVKKVIENLKICNRSSLL